MNTRYRTFFWLLLLAASPLFAEHHLTFSQAWRWIRFDTEEGLPANNIYHIVQTEDGTVWANTARGLAWYDGYVWHSAANELGLPSVRFHKTYAIGDKIFAYLTNVIWIGNQAGFKSFSVFEFLPEDFNFYEAVPLDSVSFLLLGWDVQYKQVKIFMVRQRRVIPLQAPANLMPGIHSVFFRTRSGRIWLNTAKGIYRWADGTWEPWIRRKKSSGRFTHVLENRNHTGVAIAESRSAIKDYWRWDRDRRPQRQKVTESALIVSADMDRNGCLFLVYDVGKIVVEWEDQRQELSSLPSELRDARAVFVSKSNDVWVGTSWGIYLHRRSSKRWEYYSYSSFDLRNRVHEIVEGRDGSIWLATGGGLLRIRPDGGETYITEVLGRPLTSLTAVAEDQNGHVWVGSGSAFHGTYRWDGRSWTYFGPGKGLEAGNIHRIVCDREGRLWFLALNAPPDFNENEGGGAFLYQDGRFIKFGADTGLVHKRVYGMAQGKDGALWFATLGGISKWKDGRWQHWTVKNGLRTNRTFCIYVDSRNRTWFGTHQTGIGYIENGQLTFFTENDGLLSNIIWEITEDHEGNIWCTTNAGVNIYDGKAWYKIDRNEGLLSTYTWPILIRKQKVYIGTFGGGLNILNLADIRGGLPRVYFENPEIRKRTVLLKWRTYSFYGEQRSHRIKVQYRLDGRPWSDWTLQREVFFPDLKPGNHSFEVRARGILGATTTPFHLEFKIQPAIFQRPQFYIPMAILLTILSVVITLSIIRSKQQQEQVRKSEGMYRELFENANDIIYTHDFQGTFLSINKAGERISGYSREEIVGKNISEIVCPEYLPLARDMIAKKLRENVKTTYELEIISKQGRRIPLEVSTRIIWENGKPVAIQGVARDITERKVAEKQIEKSLQEKVVLLKEIHHRVKNNLQIISSLLSLQNTKIRDRRALELLKESQDRIRTIALIHEKLYQSSDLARINFAEYIQNLSAYLLSCYAQIARKVELKIRADAIYLGIDQAIPCGLILNELLLNALKHAVHQQEKGKIQIRFARQNSRYVLHVEDDGPGFPRSFDPRNASTLGWQLIQTLTEQLNGSYSIFSQNGTRVMISFPIKEAKNGRKAI